VPKVLHIGPTSNGGIDSVLRRLTDDCVPEGYCCRRLATNGDGSLFTKLLTLAWALLTAPAALFDCDIVHIHTASYHSFLRKSVFVLLANMLNRPIVLQIHGGGFDRFVEGASPLLTCMIGRVFRSAQCILLLSETKARELGEAFPNLHAEIVPNPCPKVHVHPQARRQSRRIVYAGRIDYEKGVFDLLQAAAILSERLSEFELVLAGTGQTDEVRARAAELGIAERVRLTGWLSASDLADLYESANVFCLPSYCEALPMALLEAMSYGLAVVATPVGAIPELVKPQHTGFLVTPGQVHELAQILERLITDSELASRLGQNAQREVAQAYSPQTVTRRLAQIYDSVLKRTSPSGAPRMA